MACSTLGEHVKSLKNRSRSATSMLSGRSTLTYPQLSRSALTNIPATFHWRILLLQANGSPKGSCVIEGPRCVVAHHCGMCFLAGWLRSRARPSHSTLSVYTLKGFFEFISKDSVQSSLIQCVGGEYASKELGAGHAGGGHVGATPHDDGRVGMGDAGPGEPHDAGGGGDIGPHDAGGGGVECGGAKPVSQLQGGCGGAPCCGLEGIASQLGGCGIGAAANSHAAARAYP